MKIQRRTLVVGLGGTGCYSLRFAKKRLQEYGVIPKNRREGESAVRFVPIDLDETSRTNKEGASIDDEFIQPQGTLVSQKIRYIDRPENSDYWEWYPDKSREVIKLRQAQVGAGQWRPLGRMAYCENQNLIETAIQDALRELESLRFKGEHGIDVILVASLAGGTGSGTLLDVSYFIQSAGKGYLPTAAFLLLPSIFLDSDVGHRTDANAYAALKELSCFYRQNKDFDIHYPMRPDAFHAAAGTVVPYSNIFLFDSQLPGRTLASPRECFEYMGNMIFLRMVTEVEAQARSVFSNEAYPPKNKKGTTLKESGFLFSSCSGALFILPTEDEVASLLFDTVRNDCSSELIKAVKEEPANPTLEDWRQQVKENLIAPASFANAPKIIEGIGGGLRLKAESAKKAIAKRSTADFRAVFEEIDKLNWDKEIDHALAQQFDTFQIRLNQYLRENPKPPEAGELRFSVFTNRTRVALTLLEAQMQGLAPQATAVPVNPALEAVKEIGNTVEEMGSLRKSIWDNKDLDIPLSPIAAQASRFSMRGFDKARQAVDAFEGLFSSTALASYVQWHSDQFLRNALTRAIDQLKLEISVADRWLESFNSTSATYGASARPSTEPEGDRKALNIASIPAEKVIDGIQVARTNLVRRLDEDAMRIISNIKTVDPIVAQPKLDDATRELMSSLKYGISKDIQRQSISMSQESIGSALREILDEAKIVLFDNLVTNPCQESKVFYFRPTAAAFFWKDERDREEIDSRVKQQIRQVFPGAKIETGYSTSDYIAIYHETHHHPAANISSILRLHQAYQTVPFSPACLHIHRDYAMLDNLLGETTSYEVRCGNPKCEFNIASVPRDTYFCPSCDNPILNRCGNLSCKIDNLLERLGGLAEIKETRIMCPGCNRNIQSFWWNCPKHGFQWREKNERYCLRCNEDVTRELMALSERSRQDLGLRYEMFCIRCKRERIDSPFLIPHPELYFDVPKHRVPLLLATLEQNGLDGNLCPKCGAHIFPECPHSSNGHRHFTVKGTGGRLTCNNYNEHGGSMVLLFQCFYCDFPLTGEETTCPRCHHELMKCPNCASKEEYRYLIPKSLLGYEQRCPVCAYEVSDVQE
jgi:hypothetical protein